MPLPDHKTVAKLYYDWGEGKVAFVNQVILNLCGFAPDVYSLLYPITLSSNLGGLSGTFYFYISGRANEIRGMNHERVLLAIQNKILDYTSDLELYTINDLGIFNGKLSVLDTGP